jgi:hypothetical protein
MRRTVHLAVLAGIVGLLASGCVRLPEPRPTDTDYYLLGSNLPADTATTSDAGLRVGLRKPRMAEYLDALTIVTRHGPNEVRFSEFHRWGEDLGPAINRVVALHLEAQPGIRSAEVVPWPRGTRFDHVVQLRIHRFEGVGPPPPGPDADDDDPVPTGHAELRAGWAIYGPAGDSLHTRGQTTHRVGDWPVTDYAALVSKLDSSLAVLATDLRDRLVRRSSEKALRSGSGGADAP